MATTMRVQAPKPIDDFEGWIAAFTQPTVLIELAVLGLCIGSFLNVVIHRLPRMMQRESLHEWPSNAQPTYPSRLPMVQLDHVYARGLRPVGQMVPHGKIWQRMSDHLPLLAKFER